MQSCFALVQNKPCHFPGSSVPPLYFSVNFSVFLLLPCNKHISYLLHQHPLQPIFRQVCQQSFCQLYPRHHFEQTCQWFFHTCPPQLGSALQKHLQRGLGAQRPAGYPPVGGIHLPRFTLYLNSDCLGEGLLFASAHWETEKWQSGMHPKPTHFGFWCHLKAIWSPHWCSTLSAVACGGGVFVPFKHMAAMSVPWGLICSQQGTRGNMQKKTLFPLFLHTPLKVTRFSESQPAQTCCKRFSLCLYCGLEERKRPFSVQSVILNY